ncbi:hypothetical protein L484_004988 [Morus notabilis]|uniref:Uncharacterized protein n=1 Tax=Morus notabilis TaxID=981085 RepID=W9SEJ7_9ROSA|nr:hypothetical protein L484_004988 [Morus notabilis]
MEDFGILNTKIGARTVRGQRIQVIIRVSFQKNLVVDLMWLLIVPFSYDQLADRISTCLARRFGGQTIIAFGRADLRLLAFEDTVQSAFLSVQCRE